MSQYPGNTPQPMMQQQGQPMMQQQGQPMMYQQQPGQPMMVQGQPMIVQQQPMMVVSNQPVAVVLQNQFREVPVACTCQFCHHQIVTSTKYVNGTMSWVAVAGCCIFGFWLGCCLIPLCVEGCQDVHHFCPNCNQRIGVMRRM